MTLRRLLVFWWPLLAACGNAGFGPGVRQAGGAGTPPKVVPGSHDESSASANANANAAAPIRADGVESKPAKKGEPDDENETADPPQQVSGAFLTCAPISGPEIAAGDRGFGCRVEKDGGMVDITNETVTWDVIDGASGTSQRSSSRVVVLPPGSPWHMAVSVPAASIAGKVVTVAVDWKADPSPKPEVLRYALDKPAPSDGTTFLHYGGSGAFHLGNDAFRESKCKDGIQGVPFTGPRVGLPLTVGAGGAVVTIQLTGICGVDVYGGNDIDLYAGDQLITGFTLETKLDRDSTDTVTLPPGSYMIEIASNRLRGGDRDDFVVGDVFVLAKGLVTGGRPTALPDY